MIGLSLGESSPGNVASGFLWKVSGRNVAAVSYYICLQPKADTF